MKFRPNIKKKDQRTGLRIFGRMLLRDSFSRFFMQLFESQKRKTVKSYDFTVFLFAANQFRVGKGKPGGLFQIPLCG